MYIFISKDRAMRIGTNHGSLSSRVLSFYGDTPRGMVESAIEFADIARSLDYHNFVFSMKARFVSFNIVFRLDCLRSRYIFIMPFYFESVLTNEFVACFYLQQPNGYGSRIPSLGGRTIQIGMGLPPSSWCHRSW